MKLGGARGSRLCNPLKTKARAQLEQNWKALSASPLTDKALALKPSALSPHPVASGPPLRLRTPGDDKVSSRHPSPRHLPVSRSLKLKTIQSEPLRPISNCYCLPNPSLALLKGRDSQRGQDFSLKLLSKSEQKMFAGFWVWSLRTVIPTLGKLKQKDCSKSETSLGYKG